MECDSLSDTGVLYIGRYWNVDSFTDCFTLRLSYYCSLLSNCSATNALINSILISLDKNKFVGGLFCDLHKAFNCVNHEILLAKLEFYGISGISNKLV